MRCRAPERTSAATTKGHDYPKCGRGIGHPKSMLSPMATDTARWAPNPGTPMDPTRQCHPMTQRRPGAAARPASIRRPISSGSPETGRILPRPPVRTPNDRSSAQTLHAGPLAVQPAGITTTTVCAGSLPHLLGDERRSDANASSMGAPTSGEVVGPSATSWSKRRRHRRALRLRASRRTKCRHCIANPFVQTHQGPIPASPPGRSGLSSNRTGDWRPRESPIQ